MTRVGQLQERLVAELQQLPGVRAAGFTNFFPATGATLRYQVRVDGIAGPESDGHLTVGERTVTPGYLKALQVPVLAGEWCPDLRAGPSAPMTAMVNARFVDVYAGGRNLIGRNLIMAQGLGSWRHRRHACQHHRGRTVRAGGTSTCTSACPRAAGRIPNTSFASTAIRGA